MKDTYDGPLTVKRLEEFLTQAADILRGEVRASDYHEVIAPLLLLKRASDQPGLFTVPEHARWSDIVAQSPAELGHALNKAMRVLEISNPSNLNGLFIGIDFNNKPGRRALSRLISHFGQLCLSNDHLEFDDVVGRSYDRFLGAVSMSDRRNGEFYTPRAVCQLLAELVRPHAGQSVYDPCAGSGGMLLQAARYVAQHDGGGAGLALYGQEKNHSAWSMGLLNLLLHNVTEVSVSSSDSLAEPVLSSEGRISQFDRVLTAPPFSMNYIQGEIRHPERMKYGWAPESGKKADLMFVQHALAVLRPDGIGAVVTPHGVLFRGGAEAKIRRGFIEDGRLEAVIGIGPNVFYNTALPACILVLRGAQGLPRERRGSVLFINAEHEVAAARAQNRLDPQHVEKIAEAFLDWKDIPGFATVVPLDEIAAHDFNLNIRRYLGAGLPVEPLLDVRAVLTGGVPKREIDSARQKFHAFGIDPDDLFLPGDHQYLDFLEEGYRETAARIPELASDLEQRFVLCSRGWWRRQSHLFSDVAGTNRLFTSELRSHLRSSLRAELLPLGILDEYQLTGVLASWWSDHEDDFRSLNHRGFTSVVYRWDAVHQRRSTSSPTSFDDVRDRVLDLLGDDLCARLKQLVVAERQKLVARYLTWGDRYATSLADLEERYKAAAARLRARMAELGHR